MPFSWYMPFFIVTLTLYAMEDILLPSKFSLLIKNKNIGKFLKYTLCFGALICAIALSYSSRALAEAEPDPKNHPPPSSFMAMSPFLYDNKIPDFTHTEPYTEVCFKKGTTLVDLHLDKGSTHAGLCRPGRPGRPGDIGFIIEKNLRLKASWFEAKQTCFQMGMRIATSYEWQLACKHASKWEIANMQSGWEWASNTPYPLYNEVKRNRGVGVAVFGKPPTVAGKPQCEASEWRWAGYLSGYRSSYPFRCVL